jgi:hypothetical protein
VLGAEDSPRAGRLRQTRDFYAYLEREFPALVQRYLAEQQATSRDRDETTAGPSEE